MNDLHSPVWWKAKWPETRSLKVSPAICRFWWIVQVKRCWKANLYQKKSQSFTYTDIRFKTESRKQTVCSASAPWSWSGLWWKTLYASLLRSRGQWQRTQCPPYWTGLLYGTGDFQWRKFSGDFYQPWPVRPFQPCLWSGSETVSSGWPAFIWNICPDEPDWNWLFPGTWPWKIFPGCSSPCFYPSPNLTVWSLQLT